MVQQRTLNIQEKKDPQLSQREILELEEIDRKEKERERRLNRKWKKSLELHDDVPGIKVNIAEKSDKKAAMRAEASERKLAEQYGKMMLTEPSQEKFQTVEWVDYGNKKSAV